MSDIGDFVIDKVEEYYERTRNLKALAIEAGVSTVSLYKWLYNDYNPSIESAERVLDALGWEIIIRKKA